MATDLILRPATLDDLDLLLYWDEQPHVIASDPNDTWGWEEDLNKPQPAWREQLIAELDAKPIGFVQIIDPESEESQYWGINPGKGLRAIDIWIGEADYLNRGFGTQIMNMAIRRCFSSPEVQAILIDPLKTNVHAIRFYERLGFEFQEYRTFGNDECAVYKLERASFFSTEDQSI